MKATVDIAMTLDLLVCPGCRTLQGERLDVRTLEPVGDVLVCECGRRYPVIDGVPLVLKDPTVYLHAETATVVERDLSPEVAALLVEGGPDDDPYARLLEHLSIYLDAHWGDHAEPSPDPAYGAAPLVERIAALPRVPLAIELGCSVGRVVSALAADRVIGLDMNFGALRRARKLLGGQSVHYARRMIGRNYAPATVVPPTPATRAERVTLVCSDVHDPPVLPEVFQRVIALNMLDAVAHPRQLLAVVDGLCPPGGEVILASPYQWQSSVMAEHERIGGADPAGALLSILAGGEGLRRPYTIEDEAEIVWTLRRDARSTVTYRTHYVRARKGT